MNPTLSDKLTSHFPWFNLYCECPDEWFELIFDLLREIDDYYFYLGMEVGVIPLQCKEKYNGLRFYYGILDDENYENEVQLIVDKYELASYNYIKEDIKL